MYVKGADLMNGTPIFDIKPYIPYSDCHMEAEGSFASVHQNDKIKVYIPEELEELHRLMKKLRDYVQDNQKIEEK